MVKKWERFKSGDREIIKRKCKAQRNDRKAPEVETKGGKKKKKETRQK